MSDVVRLDSRTGRVALRDVAATRRLEASALAGLAPFTLMTRAGEAIALLAMAIAPHAEQIVVFAGPGNNGGDGIEAARRLHAWGRRVDVVQVGTKDRATDAAHAEQRARAAGVPISPFDVRAEHAAMRADVVIDALLGIGAARAPRGDIAAAIGSIAALAASGARVLAVDVPSGLDADRGQPLGDACVVADDTLTLIAAKPGLVTGSGRDRAGRLWCASLGVVDDERGDDWLVGACDPSCDEPERRHAAHKGTFGDVAVVGGASGMAGAAWLAARAAHAAGAGRVFVELLDESDATRVDPLRPELMHRPGWSAGDAARLAAATIVCGCGGGDAVRSVLPRLLSVARRLVLDADALNAIAADAALLALAAARAGRGLQTIATPHPLEAARLLGTDTAAVQTDRLGAARALALRFGGVVVLKGSGSVIADRGGAVRVNLTGNASLASAGTGDVLAGWIGGRWAASAANAFDVATRAVIEHGAAAEPAGRGAIRAGDLVEALHRRARGA